MAINNIQTLFSTIRVEEVKAYMARHDWSVKESGGRLDFLKPNPETGETRTLLLPGETAHPRFRKLLPNLIFSLAVLENREALDIANDIASSKAVSSKEVETAPAQSESPLDRQPSYGFATFRNGDTSPVVVALPRYGWQHVIKPGEKIWLRMEPIEVPLQLELEGNVAVLSSEITPLQFFSDITARQLRSDMQAWEDQLKSIVQAALLEAEALEHRSEKARDLITSFLFAIGAEPVSSITLHRSAALLLTGIAKELTERSRSKASLMEIARHLLGLHSQNINLDPLKPEELWNVCLSDSAAAPSKTLDWLQKEACTLPKK